MKNPCGLILPLLFSSFSYSALVGTTVTPLNLPDNTRLPSSDELDALSWNSPSNRGVPVVAAVTDTLAYINLITTLTGTGDEEFYLSAHNIEYVNGSNSFPVQKGVNTLVTGRSFDKSGTPPVILGNKVRSSGKQSSYGYTDAAPVTFNCTKPSNCSVNVLDPGSYYIADDSKTCGSFEQTITQSDDSRFLFYNVLPGNGTAQEICENSVPVNYVSASCGDKSPTVLYRQTGIESYVLSSMYFSVLTVSLGNNAITVFHQGGTFTVEKDSSLTPVGLSNDGQMIYSTYTSGGALCLTSQALDGSFLREPDHCDVYITGDPDRGRLLQKIRFTEDEEYGVLVYPSSSSEYSHGPVYGFVYDRSAGVIYRVDELLEKSDHAGYFDYGYDVKTEQVHRDITNREILRVSIVATPKGKTEPQAAILTVGITDE